MSNDARALGERLDRMSARERQREAFSWSRREQGRLFEAVHPDKSGRECTLESLVPPGRAVLESVRHEGINTLPAFRHFAKVFARPDGRDELWGYNDTSTFVTTTVGPGFFTARANDQPGEVLIDYLTLPPAVPPEWPALVPNEARLGRFVYAGTQDVLRSISEHVSVGRARKGDRWLPSYFVLVRVD